MEGRFWNNFGGFESKVREFDVLGAFGVELEALGAKLKAFRAYLEGLGAKLEALEAKLKALGRQAGPKFIVTCVFTMDMRVQYIPGVSNKTTADRKQSPGRG